MSLAVEFVAAAADVGAVFVVVVVAVVAAVAACIKTFVAVVLGPYIFLVSISSFFKSKSLSAFSLRYTMVSHPLALFLGVAPPSSSPSRSFQGLATKANRTRVSTPCFPHDLKQLVFTS